MSHDAPRVEIYFESGGGDRHAKVAVFEGVWKKLLL